MISTDRINLYRSVRDKKPGCYLIGESKNEYQNFNQHHFIIPFAFILRGYLQHQGKHIPTETNAVGI
jgi:hypothetical protein